MCRMVFVRLYVELSFALQKTWTFEVLDIEYATTNEELVKINLKAEHINRTTLGISGTLDVRYEFSEDTMIEMLMCRSTSGNADSYQLLPYRVPRMQIHDFFDTFYDMIFKDTGPCTNFPVIETKARDYQFCKVIYFKRCTFNNDHLPNYLPGGYYKVKVVISGEADWSLTVLFQVESTV
uniref:MD-2-related lipid-recognition domain-containing protein n=1 Tax=Glossina morsitans morsitans TaxID=37546 RepID=A0A1B0G1U1_GLOMM